MSTIFDPYKPAYNTIIVYVIIIIIFLITKPGFMYDSVNKKFKQFGCDKGQTLLPFPLLCITCGIIVYILFSFIEILYVVIDSKDAQALEVIH
ncbi:MAG: hypothetical protein Edafosvirus47_3 [Edafosvirus sp.]|uniref:Uncharacterized protein n=1 Tax=Edafosvirus sp. TaxID=2487765 RepID=A0A3G4ZVJ1_9VIRU|nr:MAG: hypothetical protein Edafosvirus47_3 [Edafosvirus sp.]